MPDVPGDPIAVSAATRSAFETESAAPQEAVPTATRSRQKPGVFGLDSDAGMRSLFESERWGQRYRSCPHERLGPQGDRAEDVGLLGNPALCGSSPGESGFVPCAGRERVFAYAWNQSGRDRASFAESILAAGRVRSRGCSSGGGGVSNDCSTEHESIAAGCGKL